MNASSASARFGHAWIAFAFALACHVVDEAAHDFLSVYNPTAAAIRARIPLLPIPTFTFNEWIIGLGMGILLLLCLSPLALRGAPWLRTVAVPLGIIVGIANGIGHIVSSVYLRRWMPGVLSAPVIIAVGAWLLVASRRRPSAYAS